MCECVCVYIYEVHLLTRKIQSQKEYYDSKKSVLIVYIYIYNIYIYIYIYILHRCSNVVINIFQ